MEIGEVIRKYRKEKNMTQEDMANRLGVTAPAVNKWENGNSMPDIMLLAPIARLLDISVDTLLSFRGELTDKEINGLVQEVSDRLKTEEYGEVFQWAKGKMEKYPNSEHLLLWMSVTLEGNYIAREVPDADKYGEYVKSIYERLLDSDEEYVKTTAADSLYGFYMRKEQYEKAEEYLEYLSTQNPERKRKKAFLCDKAGRTEEAYNAYEELLFSGYQSLNMIFSSIFAMSMREHNIEKAEMLAKKLKQLARLFDMGEYYECSAELEFIRAQEDVQQTLDCVGRMLSGVDKINSYCNSPLYGHMAFREISNDFKEELRKNLMNCFRDEESFGYMTGQPEWQGLLE